MKSITIQGQKRESVGKKSTKALRDAELVPCVVYGGKEPLHFSTEEKSFKNLVYTPEVDKLFQQYYKTFSFTQLQIESYMWISTS